MLTSKSSLSYVLCCKLVNFSCRMESKVSFGIKIPPKAWAHALAIQSQVPKTSVNLDGDVREKFMCHPSILTQGSWEWGVSQISTGRILHSGLNFRWTDFLYETFTPNPPYMVNTNTNKHNGIWFLVQMFQKESNLTKVRGEIYNFEWMFYI